MISLASQKESNSYQCSLIDEISIRKSMEWIQSRHEFSGFSDYGGGPVSKDEASKALVFLLVSLTGQWKAPVAYYLTHNMTGQQLASIVEEAINHVADFGLLVKAVVADGLKSNLKAATILGCKFKLPHNMQTHFMHLHSDFSTEKVFFICDPPHMLKLMRNLLGERKYLKRQTENGEACISWYYIKALNDLQRISSLYLANKLTDKHINYQNVKMKVHIAAQTFSSSVAVAIDHLRDDLKLQQFEGSKETTEFVRQRDRLFDMLNAKNPLGKGFKSPLSSKNMAVWLPFLTDIQQYLMSLKEMDGTPVYCGSRGTIVIGFIVTAMSTIDLAQEFISRGLRYLLPYKFSQDHIEMFFSKIRQRNGNNNNPSAEQFKSAMRSLMMINTISSSRFANVQQADDIDTVELQLEPLNRQKQTPKRMELTEEVLTQVDQMDSEVMKDSDWRLSCISYTAGFVCRMIDSKIKCNACTKALYKEVHSEPSHYLFLDRKNNGGLCIPSYGVVEVIKACEKAFNVIMPSPHLMDSLPSDRYIDLHLQTMVLSHVIDKHNMLFPSLQDHFFDHELGVEENHYSQLMKTISE